MKPLPNFPGFNYQASQLSKFIASAGLVTILLKNGEIIHYAPADIKAFVQWLVAHGVEDIKI
ncbi:MAG: hypothetical protein ABI367_02765 [Mucilaginibacter sp.]